MARRRYYPSHENQEPCYFCGGAHPATTRDHVPPRASFPDGFAPQGFDFPACKTCNEWSVKQDQIFGLYAMALDFNEANTSRPEAIAKLLKLKQGVLNNYADALPDRATAIPVYHSGVIQTLTPSAISIATPPELKEALQVIGEKLAHALYLKETGKLLTAEHRFLANVYQPQMPGTDTLTSYFGSLLPNAKIGMRNNIKNYGDRFKYMSGYKSEHDFFVYAAQFGRGLILWGIICGPLVPLPDSGPLATAPWLPGARGSSLASAHRESSAS